MEFGDSFVNHSWILVSSLLGDDNNSSYLVSILLVFTWHNPTYEYTLSTKQNCGVGLLLFSNEGWSHGFKNK